MEQSIYLPIYLYKSLNARDRPTQNQTYTVSIITNGENKLTMDITLSLVGLHNEQIGHMPTNMVLIASGITTKDLLKSVKQSAQE